MKSFWPVLRRICLILFGNAMAAFGAAVFVIPNRLISGGSTGIALLMNQLFQIPVTVVVPIFNIAMFLLGFAFLSRRLVLNTLISTIFYPTMLGLFQSIPALQALTDDTLMAAIYAGLCIGFGCGTVLRVGASTGGMDIPPLIINKFSGLSYSLILYWFDTTLLVLQMPYSDTEQVLYGILVVLINSLTINQVMLMSKTQTKVEIISEKADEITKLIQTRIGRGVTLLEAESGYRHQGQKIVMTVLSNREFPRLNRLVMELDPKAFMIVSQVGEVRGLGFTFDQSGKAMK